MLMQQRILLEMEHAAEREAFKKLTETMGLQRKVKRGDAWFPITTGKAFYNSLNQYVIEVFRNADEDTDHNFEYGKPLMFSALMVISHIIIIYLPTFLMLMAIACLLCCLLLIVPHR